MVRLLVVSLFARPANLSNIIQLDCARLEHSSAGSSTPRRPVSRSKRLARSSRRASAFRRPTVFASRRRPLSGNTVAPPRGSLARIHRASASRFEHRAAFSLEHYLLQPADFIDLDFIDLQCACSSSFDFEIRRPRETFILGAKGASRLDSDRSLLSIPNFVSCDWTLNPVQL